MYSYQTSGRLVYVHEIEIHQKARKAKEDEVQFIEQVEEEEAAAAAFSPCRLLLFYLSIEPTCECGRTRNSALPLSLSVYQIPPHHIHLCSR